jgi:hypothetical protein
MRRRRFEEDFMLVQTAAETYLGPGRVTRLDDPRVQLQLTDQRVWARLALALPYQPAIGDTLLVIGQVDDWYVIGVLEGSGQTTLTAPADLKLAAPRGKIELLAAQGVTIHSPATVRIVADQLEVAARSLVEKFTSATRWVTNLFRLRAGHAHTTVDSSYRLQAQKITARAQDDVHIDGNKIHLG